jgi:hypothetical protein
MGGVESTPGHEDEWSSMPVAPSCADWRKLYRRERCTDDDDSSIFSDDDEDSLQDTEVETCNEDDSIAATLENDPSWLSERQEYERDLVYYHKNKIRNIRKDLARRKKAILGDAMSTKDTFTLARLLSFFTCKMSTNIIIATKTTTIY